MNQEILDVIANKDYMKMAYKSGLRYATSLTMDEIENCILHAAWKSLRNYDENMDGKCSFSSYLYRGVGVECLNYAQREVQPKQFPRDKGDLTRYVDGEYLTDDRIDMLDELGQTDDPDMMFDRFYNNMTLQEIADKKGQHRQNIALKIGKNLDLLRRRLSKSV